MNDNSESKNKEFKKIISALQKENDYFRKENDLILKQNEFYNMRIKNLNKRIDNLITLNNSIIKKNVYETESDDTINGDNDIIIEEKNSIHAKNKMKQKRDDNLIESDESVMNNIGTLIEQNEINSGGNDLKDEQDDFKDKRQDIIEQSNDVIEANGSTEVTSNDNITLPNDIGGKAGTAYPIAGMNLSTKEDIRDQMKDIEANEKNIEMLENDIITQSNDTANVPREMTLQNRDLRLSIEDNLKGTLRKKYARKMMKRWVEEVIYFMNNKKVKSEAIQIAMGISTATLMRDIALFKNKGWISFSGYKKNGYYTMTEKGKQFAMKSEE